MVGYFGRGGESAESVFRSAQTVLTELEPLIAAPSQSETGEAAFGFSAARDDSILSAAAPDGSFMMMSGRTFTRRSATELLESWLADGAAAFKDLYFHGLVAAWNAQTSDFVLMRDRYGVETGYYATTDQGILFADDQQSLLRLGVDATPSVTAIDTFLTCGYFAAPLTPYESIAKVAAGGLVTFADGEASTTHWATYEPSRLAPFDAALRQAAPLLQAALERTWPSHGDVGLLLSGGIDSAMLLVGITEMLGQSVRAFTFRYDDYQGQLNEGEAASVIARHLNVAHEEIRIRPQDLMDDLDAAVAAYGEPLNWGLHSYRLGPIAERGINTVFSGVGADGTGVTKRHQAALRFRRLPGPLQSAMRTAVRAGRPLGLGVQAKAEWVTRRTAGLGDLFSPDSDHNRALRARVYNDPSLAVRGSELLRSIYNDAAMRFDPDQPEMALTLMDKQFTSAEAMLAWNRAWPREHGLAARLPYYDPDVVSWGLHIEGDSAGKDLMRRVAESSLPSEIAQAPKIAQKMPVGHWLRGPLADAARDRLSAMPAAMEEVFDPVVVGSIVDRHVAGSADLGSQIVSLLTLSSWYAQQPD